MTTITFDTYAFIKELKEAGFSEQKANVIAKQQQKVVDILLHLVIQTMTQKTCN